MDLCSYESSYWDPDQKNEIEFPCNNDPKPQSDKYIFHDPHFLDNIEIERSFSSPVYLKYLNIFGSVTINAGFLNYVSFSNSTFSEKVMLTSQDLDST
jgi:hypothetical protein